MAVYLNNRKKLEIKYESPSGPVFHFTLDPDEWIYSYSRAPFSKIREADLFKFSWDVSEIGGDVKPKMNCQEFTLRLNFKNALTNRDGDIEYLGGTESHGYTLVENFNRSQSGNIIGTRNNETMMNMIMSLEDIVSLDAARCNPGKLFVKVPRTNGTTDEYYTYVIVKEMSIIPIGKEFTADVEIKFQQAFPFWYIPITFNSIQATSGSEVSFSRDIRDLNILMGADFIIECLNSPRTSGGQQNFSWTVSFLDRNSFSGNMDFAPQGGYSITDKCKTVLDTSKPPAVFWYENNNSYAIPPRYAVDCHLPIPAGRVSYLHFSHYSKKMTMTILKRVPWPSFGTTERSGH